MSTAKTETIAEAKRYSDELRKRLPPSLEIASISTTAKIPFKAVSWSIAVLYRASELADCAYELHNANRYVSSSIIGRALMETAGMMYWMHRRIDNAVRTQQLGDIDDFLMRGTLGYKETNGFPSALSALSAVNHIDKQFKGFRGVYDILSEFTHPNWSGTLGAYSKPIKEKMRVEYGPAIKGLSWDFIPSSMCMSLMVIETYYDKLQGLFPQFIQLCEEDLKQTMT